MTESKVPSRGHRQFRHGSRVELTSHTRCVVINYFFFLFFLLLLSLLFFASIPTSRKVRVPLFFQRGSFSLSLSLPYLHRSLSSPLRQLPITHTHTNVLRLDYYMYATAQQQQQKKRREITSEGRPGPLLSPTIRPKL